MDPPICHEPATHVKQQRIIHNTRQKMNKKKMWAIKCSKRS